MRPRGLPRLARLELADARLELRELGKRSLEQLLLYLKILARHEIEPVEPRGEESAQVLLYVLSGRVTQSLIEAAAQIVEKLRVHHAPKVSQAWRPN